MLIGASKVRPGGERVGIRISSEVRDRFRDLLYAPEMRGVGWSEFVLRAIEQAESELAAAKQEAAS